MYASTDEIVSSSEGLLVTKQVWMQFMRLVRPDLDPLKQEVLYTTLRLTEEDLTSHPQQVQQRLNDSTDGLTLSQFLRLPEFIEIKFRISHKAGIAHELIKLQNRLNRIKLGYMDSIKYLHTRFRVFFLYIFSHPMSEQVIDWLVWVNAMSFIAEKFTEEYYGRPDGLNFFEILHKTFLVVFSIEILLKVHAFGFRAFLSDNFYIFDAVLVISGLVAWIYSNDDDSYVQLIRSLRLLRVLKEFAQMRLLVLFLRSLMRAFIILLLAQFCVFYVFSNIGMALFDGKLGRDQIMTEIYK